MKVFLGPPGAGKTRLALDHAIGTARRGGRAIVASLPPAWRYLTRRLARQGGAVLGAEVRHLQAVYTELLAEAGLLEEPFDRVDRLVTVARLLESAGPGKARLYAGAIGELKRFGVPPTFEPFDTFTEELKEIYQRYEELKRIAGVQDLDDRRLLAIEAVGKGIPVPFDTLVVDGYREITPLEARFLRELAARGVDVLLTLPAPAFGVSGEQLPPRELEVRRYMVDNPVNEARFVLAEAAHALEEGLHPAEVAVVVPEGLATLYREIAAGMGVPLTDELRPLTDVDAGAAALYELLSLPDHPTPAGLKRVPGLEPLAKTLVAWEAAGQEALTAALEVAEEEIRDRWAEVLRLLSPDQADENWVLRVVELAGPSEHKDALVKAGFRAIQASEKGDGAREWWRHLLEDLRAAPEGEGITLTSPERLASRRYLRSFVAGATASRYKFHNPEDFFFPEEARTKIPGLPPRLRDQATRFFQEVAGSGEVTVITAHRTETAGLEDPHPLLFPDGTPVWASGPRPAARARYGPPRPFPKAFLPRTLGDFKHAELCATQFLYRKLLPEREPKPFWQILDSATTPEERIEALGLPATFAGGRQLARVEVRVPLDGHELAAQIPLVVEKEGRLLVVFPGYEYEPHPAEALAAIELARLTKATTLTVAVYHQNYRKLYPSRACNNLPARVWDQHKTRLLQEALDRLSRIRQGKTVIAASRAACEHCNLEAVCRRRSAERRKEAP